MEFITRLDFFIDMGFLIDMTFTFTVTAAIILAVKFAFKDKFTPKWQVLVWLILLVRLLSPVFPESNLSVFNFIPNASESYMNYVGTQTGEQTQGTGGYQNTEANRLADQPAQDSNLVQGTGRIGQNVATQERPAKKFIVAEKIILLLYMTGVLGMAISLIFGYRNVGRALKRLPRSEKEDVLTSFEQAKVAVGIKGNRLEVRIGAVSPMLVGIIKPRVYISEEYEVKDLPYIFTHELCHYKNGDILWNLISSACLCLNWFNPLAWFAVKVFRRDLEIYCDYRAVKILGRAKDYAEILVKTATGKKSFLIASTCLENGEKEVSVRIKKLAAFKEPKLWVSFVGVILVVMIGVFCLTNGGKKGEEAEVIDLAGPTNQWAEYSMDIPAKWTGNSVIIRPEKNSDLEKRVFYDRDGKETITLEYKMWEAENGLVEGAIGLEEQIGDLATAEEERRILPDGSEVEYILVGPTQQNSPSIFAMYQVQYFNNAEEGSDADKSDGVVDKKEVLKQGLYLPLAEDCTIIPVLYTNNPALVSMEDLFEIAQTIVKAEEPEQYRPTATAQLLSDAEKGVAIPAGDYDAEELLREYLQNYVDTKLPIVRDIKGYKINSMEQIQAVGDIPSIIDEGMYEGETAPWNIIYPSARLYKIDYELIPQTVGKYGDFAGGGFEETEEGNKRYAEAYGVFYGYSVDGKSMEARFLGFLHPSNLAEYGVDYSAMSKLDQWYEMAVWPDVRGNAKVQYVGDASAVGKLAGLLPLHEYYSGMELQTTEEPYGVTLNYQIGRIGDRILVHPVTGKIEVKSSKKNNGILVAWPALNGEISGIRSKVKEGSKTNHYIEKRIGDNATRLVREGTEYTGLVVTMNYESPYTEPCTIVYSEPERNKQ